VSEEAAPKRIVVVWSPEARTDLRAIEREPAMQILYCVDRYLSGRTGDVKKLKPPLTGFRLRCGDFRVFFDYKDEFTIEVTGVRNRRTPTAESRKRAGDTLTLVVNQQLLDLPLNVRGSSLDRLRSISESGTEGRLGRAVLRKRRAVISRSHPAGSTVSKMLPGG
jgi:mRNA-degrading endonuclease RelE of RelBE toxin-antitoxin system